MHGKMVEGRKVKDFALANIFDLSHLGKRLISLFLGQDEVDVVTLREGDCGPEVRQLQEQLSTLNLYHGELSGHFDSITRQALEAFQRQFELNESGYFGTETWYALTFWSKET